MNTSFSTLLQNFSQPQPVKYKPKHKNTITQAFYSLSLLHCRCKMHIMWKRAAGSDGRGGGGGGNLKFALEILGGGDANSLAPLYTLSSIPSHTLPSVALAPVHSRGRYIPPPPPPPPQFLMQILKVGPLPFRNLLYPPPAACSPHHMEEPRSLIRTAWDQSFFRLIE